jgi:hypothetical protein
MIPKGQYPTGLKTVLKAGPGIIVMCGFGLVFCTTLHGILFHPHERVERFIFLFYFLGFTLDLIGLKDRLEKETIN